MAELLPTFIALKSAENQKYLVYKDQATTELPHILQFSGEKVYSKYARFKVEKDEKITDLVHIKSTYIDQYWRTASRESPWIVAGADEKQPNKELWSCTLFQPEVLQPDDKGNSRYQFRHVKTGNLIELTSGDEFSNIFGALQETPTQNTAFIVKKLPG